MHFIYIVDVFSKKPYLTILTFIENEK